MIKRFLYQIYFYFINGIKKFDYIFFIIEIKKYNMTDDNIQLKKELKLLLKKKDLNTKFPLKYADLLACWVGKEHLIVNSNRDYVKVKHFGECPTLIMENLREAGDNEISKMPYFQLLDKCRKNNAMKQKQKFNMPSMEGGGDDTLENLLKGAANQKMDDRYLKCPGDVFSLKLG